MKPKLIALNLLLLSLLAAIGWQARTRWQESQAQRRNSLNVAVKPLPPPPLTPAAQPEAAPATKYAEVATKNLFSKDRNPTVIIDPPKVEKPKEMPPLPVVYGVLGLPSGTQAIMSERVGATSRSVRPGDNVGEFKIVSLDPRNVTFDWEGKQVSRRIEDLIDRSGASQAAAAPPSAAQPSAPVIAAAPPPPANTPPPAAGPGAEIPTAPGQTQRACVPGDKSPAGTVVNGFKKTEVRTPFGVICNWFPAQ